MNINHPIILELGHIYIHYIYKPNNLKHIYIDKKNYIYVPTPFTSSMPLDPHTYTHPI